jgi:flagellar basal-body rod protein FlgF
MNGLYLAASGAAAGLQTLDFVTSNLANLSTPGFRRILAATQAVTGNGSPYEYAETPATASIDMHQGPLQATGNPLDVAITGSGFLVVQTPDGYAYTRNGELQVSETGELMAAGAPVVGEGGGTITLTPGTISVGGDGTINVNGQPRGRIALADPSGLTLTPIGQGLYRPAGGAVLPLGGVGQFHQGFVERSTGSEVAQMVSMMSVSRSYESSMKAVQVIDENHSRTIDAFTLNA